MYVIDSYSLNVCINIIYVERITCLGVAPCDPSSRISRDSVQLLIKSSWNETLIGLMPMAGRFHMKIYFKTEISVSYNCIHVPIRILWIWYVTGKQLLAKTYYILKLFWMIQIVSLFVNSERKCQLTIDYQSLWTWSGTFQP